MVTSSEKKAALSDAVYRADVAVDPVALYCNREWSAHFANCDCRPSFVKQHRQLTNAK